ncbi:MAG: hypothetical protein R2726_18555 [Acidimicrobiales bacterium]
MQGRVWSLDEVGGWFAGRVPDGWFTGPPSVQADRDELLVVGELAAPDVGDDATDEARRVAEGARLKGFREDTRAQRMRIADEAEVLWVRKVSWGARCGQSEVLFTTQSVPVMTRLRLPERVVLDTLIDAGVARSRSEALAWCVRLVGRHQAEWIAQLREAMTTVERVRAEGPDLDGG